MKKFVVLFVMVFFMERTLLSYTDAPYLGIPAGAKSAAMGGAYGAVYGDIESLWYNPAGLAKMKNMQMMLSHVSWVGEVNMEHMLFGIPFGENISAGIGINYNHTTDNYYDSNGLYTGEFNVSNMTVNAGCGMSFGFIDAGISLKMTGGSVFSAEAPEINRGSFGFITDLGMLAHFTDDRINVGITLQNIFTAVKYDGIEAEYGAPVVLKISAAEKDFIEGLLLSQEYCYNPQNGTGYFAFGLQKELAFGDFNLAARGGYEMKAINLGGLSGITIGAGAGYDGFRVDYTFVPYDFAGITHRFSLSYEFGRQ